MATGPLFVGAEEVILRKDSEHYGSSRPIMEGLELVMMLNHSTARLVVHCNTPDKAAADFFVKINGLPKAAVITLDTPAQVITEDDPHLAQWEAINRQRAKGPLSLVVTGYQSVFDMCSRSHQPVLLYGRRGQVASEQTIPSWGELQESVRKQREATVDQLNEPEY